MQQLIDLIHKFSDIQALLLSRVPTTFIRNFQSLVDWKGRLIGVVGPRGVGKTTLLLQQLALKKELDRKKSLYLSADSVLLRQTSLFELAECFYLQMAGKTIIIDEVHRIKNWSTEIKSIYDSLPELQIIFSGSSQINILKGRADLSRRANIYTMAGLSFREYLLLEFGIILPIFSLEDLLKNHTEIATEISNKAEVLSEFNNYLISKYYPFYRENTDTRLYHRQIINILDKTIFEDLALSTNVQSENLIVFKEIMAFLSSITPSEINIHKIAKNIRKKDDTIKSYLQTLHDCSLIRFLPKALSGHAKLKSAQKIFFDNTNILAALCFFSGHTPEAGLMRETFATQQLQSAGLLPLAPKTGDLQIDELFFEIGGANKSAKQVINYPEHYVLSADILIGSNNKMPLYLLGFLY